MLTNLVESGSHTSARKRHQLFMLATLGGYLVLLLAAGTASIYAYDAHITADTEEQIEFITFAPIVPPVDPPRPLAAAAPRAPATTNLLPSNVVERKQLIAPINRSPTTPPAVSTAPQVFRSVPDGALVRLSERDTGGSLAIPNTGARPNEDNNFNSIGGERGVNAAPPPPPLPQPAAATKKPVEAVNAAKRRVSKGVVNGLAIDLPTPAYTQAARIIKASGVVTVQVVIDDKGKVISAQVTSGHPLLRVSAMRAALQARFRPTLLSGEPVSVQGIIKYQFKLE